MMNLKQLLKKPLQAVPSSLVIFLLVIALIGFIDASYLTVEHYQGRVPPCSITSGCELVLTSSYSMILGVPVSLMGSIFYLLVLVGVFGYLESKKTWLLKWALLLTIPGLLASFCFVYIQVFIIHSYCLYCLVSAFTSTVLFAVAMEIFKKYQEK